jgi:hypothetical protein
MPIRFHLLITKYREQFDLSFVLLFRITTNIALQIKILYCEALLIAFTRIIGWLRFSEANLLPVIIDFGK